jgi:hypothetical protein
VVGFPDQRSDQPFEGWGRHGSTGRELPADRVDVYRPLDRVEAAPQAQASQVVLHDGIDAVDTDDVVLETIDPLKPATLHAADNGDFLYLLMPVRTS